MRDAKRSLLKANLEEDAVKQLIFSEDGGGGLESPRRILGSGLLSRPSVGFVGPSGSWRSGMGSNAGSFAHATGSLSEEGSITSNLIIWRF